jgi:uncharacterized protein (TIGR02453 family)
MAIAIQNKSLEFLKKLALNNNRDWFNAHKKEFKSVEADIKIVYSTVFNNLKVHDDVDTMKLFRIYRDVRFSKNKLPYKTHFGGSFSRVKPALRGGYYLHIAPNDESFIATGFWEPNKEDLLRIRKEIEMDDEEIRNIINQSSLKNIWGNLIGDELVSAPRGFDKNHKAIDLIRKKQYIFTKKFTDKDVLSENFINEVNIAFKAIRPYFNYMSDVLTTDLNGESLI